LWKREAFDTTGKYSENLPAFFAPMNIARENKMCSG
jgi:hypothetical protein